MKKYCLLALMKIFVLTLLLCPNAYAYMAVNIDDPAFTSLPFTMSFAAEGRIGNNAMNGDFEVDLHLNSGAPNVTDQAVWTKATATPFTVTYDALSKAVSYSTLGKTLNWTYSAASVSDIFIRTRALQAESSMRVFNVLVNGESILGQSFAYPGNDPNYLWISGLDPSANIVITGESIMDWGAVMPLHSQLAYQVKFGTVTPIPGAAWLLGSGLAGLIALRRKKKAGR
jgi:hypothetical protein